MPGRGAGSLPPRAAVDVETLTGDGAGLVVDEQPDHSRDLLDRDEAADRLHSLDPLARLFRTQPGIFGDRLDRAFSHRSVHVARADGVGSDTTAGEFGGHRADQPQNTMLGL